MEILKNQWINKSVLVNGYFSTFCPLRKSYYYAIPSNISNIGQYWINQLCPECYFSHLLRKSISVFTRNKYITIQDERLQIILCPRYKKVCEFFESLTVDNVLPVLVDEVTSWWLIFIVRIISTDPFYPLFIVRIISTDPFYPFLCPPYQGGRGYLNLPLSVQANKKALFVYRKQ